jgi:hypothetical protein
VLLLERIVLANSATFCCISMNGAEMPFNYGILLLLSRPQKSVSVSVSQIFLSSSKQEFP